ncbi:MAG: hypothetical protein K6A38_07590 [Lachnospiraceae bacterium]|nr:hypothetical protein [Lachnospiraceae bacterium]
MEKLKDDELNKVSGGAGTPVNKTGSAVDPANCLGTKVMKCDKCDADRKFYLFTGGRCVCSECGNEIFK